MIIHSVEYLDVDVPWAYRIDWKVFNLNQVKVNAKIVADEC